MLDKYSVVIRDNDPTAQIKRKNTMKKIKASELRKWSFKYITKHIGRGENRHYRNSK